jgi:hypothetical protein
MSIFIVFVNHASSVGMMIPNSLSQCAAISSSNAQPRHDLALDGLPAGAPTRVTQASWQMNRMGARTISVCSTVDQTDIGV